ncbi:MAG: 1-(5-phosphoribosyl)-5-[(5-phosphoribosylamino)methylideneamino]imidazole-4-carboxamide isomerase [Patescibacteria group bacterium]
MLIIPAIDIKNGKCVRLYKGDFNKATIFSDDPLDVAKNIERDGSKYLHCIDLDGANKGKLVNFNLIKKIAKNTDLKIQYGGGIRNVESINQLLDLKINKIILSTSLINNPEIINDIDKSKIIMSVDGKKGKVCIKGWKEKTNINVSDLIEKFSRNQINNFIYTDIEKDGTLTSPNFSEIKKIRNKFLAIDLTIAGGVSSKKDLEKLNSLKINKVIIGKALYTNNNLKKYVSQKNYTLS